MDINNDFQNLLIATGADSIYIEEEATLDSPVFADVEDNNIENISISTIKIALVEILCLLLELDSDVTICELIDTKFCLNLLQELHAKLASLNNKEKKFNSLLQTTEKKFLLPTFNKLTGKMSIDILLQAEKHLLTRMWFSNGLHKEKSIDFDPASKSSIGETEM